MQAKRTCRGLSIALLARAHSTARTASAMRHNGTALPRGAQHWCSTCCCVKAAQHQSRHTVRARFLSCHGRVTARVCALGAQGMHVSGRLPSFLPSARRGWARCRALSSHVMHLANGAVRAGGSRAGAPQPPTPDSLGCPTTTHTPHVPASEWRRGSRPCAEVEGAEVERRQESLTTACVINCVSRASVLRPLSAAAVAAWPVGL